MLQELLTLFRQSSREGRIAQDLDEMIQESAELVRLAGDVYYQRAEECPTVDDLKKRDKGVNKLQQRLRKEAFGEALADSRHFSLPFCLSVVNIVKDLERVGDYAKDLAELAETAGPAQPAEEEPRIREVEQFLQRLSPTMRAADQVAAVRLIDLGKDLRREFYDFRDTLLTERQTRLRAAADALATHYYIRIVGHALNVLSTLVTPIHRMDYLGKKSLLPEVKQRLQKQAERPDDEADGRLLSSAVEA